MNHAIFRRFIPSPRQVWVCSDQLSRLRLPAFATLTLAVAGCGSAEDENVFPRSTSALVANSGETCESFPLSENEVTVEDDNETCLPGYCVTRGTDPGGAEGLGMCTCRCAGPPGAGPLCTCGEGFSCQEVIKAFGIDDASGVVGSYCLPETP